MPKAVILFSESELSDLKELKAWYADRGAPHIGDRFVTEIIEKIETPRDHPNLGRVVLEFEKGR